MATAVSVFFFIAFSLSRGCFRARTAPGAGSLETPNWPMRTITAAPSTTMSLPSAVRRTSDSPWISGRVRPRSVATALSSSTPSRMSKGPDRTTSRRLSAPTTGAMAMPRRSPAAARIASRSCRSAARARRSVRRGMASQVSRQPALPHAHVSPPSVPTTTWPISPAAELAPCTSVPPTTSAGTDTTAHADEDHVVFAGAEGAFGQGGGVCVIRDEYRETAVAGEQFL